MGNYISFQSREASGKVVLSDGTVHEFDQPVTVAELMLEHPQQVVVEFESAVSGKRPSPLPADKTLETKRAYLMLPVKRGKPVAWSTEEARRLLLRASTVLRSQSLLSSRFLPLLARICPAGVEEEERLVVEEEESLAERFQPEFALEGLEERPEYLSRQLSAKGWKPSLDTIKEKMVEKKVPHWLL